MHRLLAAAAIAAAATPIALFSTGTAHAAASHSRSCESHRSDGFNVIIGTRFDDTLFGTRCDDAIFGRGGNDRVVGHGGADLLVGNRGDDTLIDDQPSFFGNVVTLRGGLGNDVCIGNVNDVFLGCETVIVL